MEKQKKSRFSLLFAVFGFMLIIAKGTDIIIGRDEIPMIVPIIGLSLIIIAMLLKRRTEQ